ncbi:nidogen-like domain-containing protein [Sphingomonas pituitosa]|uniref:nidogen-like domain-containing protein n=1 Tax=Sphingomonas pituitosa TaxID=99597 RepID=UPI00082C2F26|nr:nidogen-like domain-containing protein [Sphingomonas pituitosa]
MRNMATGMAGALALVLASPAGAAALRGGMGGPAGYGTLVLQPNDDDFSAVLNSPFQINFFGYSGTSFFVNNNGNISFGSGLSGYTPSPFDGHAAAPLIAPFWADVDTRCAGCGAVYLGTQSPNSFTVTWNNVGYYGMHGDRLNNFQMTLAGSSTPGDFDIEFRYNRLEWTTGDASGGENGLGGVPAQAGFDAGDGTHFFSLPGSFSSTGALNFANITNVPGGDLGLYKFSIRNGGVLADGSSAAAPLLPSAITSTNGRAGFQFQFQVEQNQRVFVDPVVAVGYDFTTAFGSPIILTALFPDLGDPDGYTIFLLDDLVHPFATHVGAYGNSFLVDFASAGGVSGFRIAGINPSLGLDPANPSAFVTGLTFDVAGPAMVNLTQTPIRFDTASGAVPEPGTWGMLLAGFAMAGSALRRRDRRTPVRA